MKALARQLSDAAVWLLSHPICVALWWLVSLAAIGWCAFKPSELGVTLALSFLALAYSAAIAERQIRNEDSDKFRDEALHVKIDELIRAIPQANDHLRRLEKQVVAAEPLAKTS